MDCSGESLLCEETMVGSPWYSDSESRPHSDHSYGASWSCHSFQACSWQLEDEEAFGSLIDREHENVPHTSYALLLQQSSHISQKRLKAVCWVLKAQRFFNFTSVTASLAINYLDRYLEKNLAKAWKGWMVELLSIACLSIAAKLEEVHVPSLLHLQIEGLEHKFLPATIQRMELNVLSILQWKLKPITPFAFVEHILSNMNIAHCSLTRISELLLGSLAEIEFLNFRASVVAISSICCAVEEIAPLQSEFLKQKLWELAPVDKANILLCYKLMEELVADPLPPLPTGDGYFKSPLSPVAVVPEKWTFETVLGEICEVGSLHSDEYPFDPSLLRDSLS